MIQRLLIGIAFLECGFGAGNSSETVNGESYIRNGGSQVVVNNSASDQYLSRSVDLSGHNQGNKPRMRMMREVTASGSVIGGRTYYESRIERHAEAEYGLAARGDHNHTPSHLKLHLDNKVGPQSQQITHQPKRGTKNLVKKGADLIDRIKDQTRQVPGTTAAPVPGTSAAAVGVSTTGAAGASTTGASGSSAPVAAADGDTEEEGSSFGALIEDLFWILIFACVGTAIFRCAYLFIFRSNDDANDEPRSSGLARMRSRASTRESVEPGQESQRRPSRSRRRSTEDDSGQGAPRASSRSRYGNRGNDGDAGAKSDTLSRSIFSKSADESSDQPPRARRSMSRSRYDRSSGDGHDGNNS